MRRVPEKRRGAIASVFSKLRSNDDNGFSIEDLRQLETNTLQHLLPQITRIEVPLLERMSMAVLRTSDPLGFVTTDTPVMYFDPTAYRRPPLFRAPGLAWPGIEVTMPLSPQLCLALTHRANLKGFFDIESSSLDELNRLRIAMCDQNFIACRNEIRPQWFAQLPMPEDAWEIKHASKVTSGE